MRNCCCTFLLLKREVNRKKLQINWAHHVVYITATKEEEPIPEQHIKDIAEKQNSPYHSDVASKYGTN